MAITQKDRIVYLRDLLFQLVGRDLKLRYRGSALGIAWSLLNPLVQLLVFSFVFRTVLPLDIPNYTIFLFIGLLAWNWFQTSLLGSSTVLLDSRMLIKQPTFPSVVLPIVVVTANLLHFFLALPILFAFVRLSGIPFTTSLIALPIVIVLQMTLTLSLAYFVATFNVFFRDIQHLVGVFLFLFFYLTPVFYNVDVIPAPYQPIYRLNPMLQLLEAYRAILLGGVLPSAGALISVGVISAALLVLGCYVFTHASHRFAEEL